jgi:hypothetical protein
MPGTSFSIFHFPISHDKPVKQVKDGEGKKTHFGFFQMHTTLSNFCPNMKDMKHYEGKKPFFDQICPDWIYNYRFWAGQGSKHVGYVGEKGLFLANSRFRSAHSWQKKYSNVSVYREEINTRCAIWW